MSYHYITDEPINLVNRVQDNVTAILSVFTLTWLFFYSSVRKTFPNRSPEFCVRLITLFHGSVTSYLGFQECTGGHLFEAQSPMTNNQALILAFSASYFVFDLIWCLFYQTETKLMLFHHLYSCIALTRIVTQGYAGTQSICGVGTAEITNPLLQARWFLRTFDQQNSYLYALIEFMFVLTFIVARIMFGTVFILAVILSTTNNIEYKLLSLLIYVLSWLFLLNIIQYVKNKYIHSSSLVEDDFKHAPSS